MIVPTCLRLLMVVTSLGLARAQVASPTSEVPSIKSLTWGDVVENCRESGVYSVAEAWLDGRATGEILACAAMLDDEKSMPPKDADKLWEALMVRWALRNVNESFDWMAVRLEKGHLLTRGQLVGWSRGALQTPQRVLELLKPADRTVMRAHLLPALGEVLPGPDYRAAYAFMKEMGGLEQDPDVLEEFVAAAAIRIGRLALSCEERSEPVGFFESLRPSHFRDQVLDLLRINPHPGVPPDESVRLALARNGEAGELGWLYFQWFKEDKDAAWRDLEAVEENRRGPIQSALVSHVANQFPELVPWLLDKKPIDQLDPRTLISLVGPWMHSDEPGAVNWLRANKHRIPPEFWPEISSRAAEAPRLARFLLQEVDMTPEEKRDISTPQLLGALGRHDPPAAVEWIEANVEAKNKAYMYAGQFGIWGGREPRLAMSCLNRLARVADNREALGVLFEAWAKTDWPNASKQAAALPPGEARRRAVSACARGGAPLQPRPAARLLASVMGESDVNEWRWFDFLGSTCREVGLSLVIASPAELIDWLATEVPESHRYEAAEAAFSSVNKWDPGFLDRLLVLAPAGDIADAALELKARSAGAFENPREALELALRISRTERREQVTRLIVTSWHANDPVYCRFELERWPLPADEKQKILELLPTQK